MSSHEPTKPGQDDDGTGPDVLECLVEEIQQAYAAESLDPVLESLREKVIEEARKLVDVRTVWLDAVDAGDLPDDECPESLTEQADCVCEAVAALDAYLEKKDVSRTEVSTGTDHTTQTQEPTQ